MKKILILPDAGLDNPFQFLLASFLKKEGFDVHAAPSKRFWATVTSLRLHNSDFIYYDWIQSFIIGRTLLLTLLKSICFLLEVLYVRKIKGIPIIHTLHNIQNHAGHYVKVERAVYYYFLRHCSKVRVYSETTRCKIIRLYRLAPEKVVVIQDVPYHYYYPNSISREEGRSSLNLPTNALVYLFFGMVKPYKGLEVLINVFADMAQPNEYLVIGGESDVAEYGHAIQTLAAKHPHILCHNYFIDKSKVQYYYTAADVVVLPFKNIEHSGSVDLAMSFGKPIITLKTPFIAKLLNHQAELLFKNPSELPVVLKTVRNMENLEAIGTKNFQLADQVNYKDLLLLFQ